MINAGAINAAISPLGTSSQQASVLPYPSAWVAANEMATIMAGKPRKTNVNENNNHNVKEQSKAQSLSHKLEKLMNQSERKANTVQVDGVNRGKRVPASYILFD